MDIENEEQTPTYDVTGTCNKKFLVAPKTLYTNENIIWFYFPWLHYED